MTILQGAVDAAEATLRAILEPWLSAKAHGTTLGTQLRAAAACALRDAEKAWPREPPQRDPASTTSAQVERATQFDYDQRRPASFGFGPPAYVGGASVDEGYRDEKWRDAQS